MRMQPVLAVLLAHNILPMASVKVCFTTYLTEQPLSIFVVNAKD